MNSYLIVLLVYLIWIANAVLEGWSEARFWYYKYNGKAEYLKNIDHSLWTAQRFILGITLTYILSLSFSWASVAGGLAMITMFPYFHDGAYYYFRNKYDHSYPLGWKDTSRTSTAKTKTIDYRTRIVLTTVFPLLLTLFMLYYDK